MTVLIASLFLLLPLIVILRNPKQLANKLKRNWQDIAVLSGLVTLYFWMCAPTVLHEHTNIIHDNWSFSGPFFGLVVEALHQSKEFPFWMPEINFGIPTLLCTINFYVFLITRFPFYLLAIFAPEIPSTLQLYKLNLVFNHILFMLFFFLLLKELLKSRAAVYWGCVLALFSGVSTSTFMQEQLAASILYIPLILFLAIKLYRTERTTYAILLGCFLGQALCNHYPQLVSYFLFIAALSLALTHPAILAKLWTERSVWIKRFGMIFGIVVLMIALPATAYFQYAKQVGSDFRPESHKLSASYKELTVPGYRNANDLHPATLLSYFHPRMFYNANNILNSLYPISNYKEYLSKQGWSERSSYYIGILGILLFFFALFTVPWRTKLCCALMVLGVVLFAMGDHGFVYYWLFKYVPLARLQRIPTHMGNFVNIGVILLSCFGIQEALRRIPKSKFVLAPSLVILFGLLFWDLSRHFEILTHRSFRRVGAPPTFVKHRLERFLYFRNSRAYYKRLDKEDRRSPSVLFLKDSQGNQSRSGIDIVEQSNNRIIATVNHPEKSTLVYRSNFDPIWKTKVESKPVNPLPVDNMFVGVPLGGGTQLVEFSYVPRLQIALLILNMLLILGSIVLMIRELLREEVIEERASQSALIPTSPQLNPA